VDDASKAVLEVLIYLLPGLVSAAIVYVLTPAVRPIPFERLVQALIYTIVVQALVVLVRGMLHAIGTACCSLGTWTSDVALVWSVVLAVVVGLLSTWADNTDCVHRLLRHAGITFQTSFPSEWFGAFSQNEGYVVLHLKGERRLYGWAEEWPSSPATGHFVVTQAEWLTTDGRVELDGVQRILVRAEDVEMVEMMKKAELSTETSDGRSQGTDPSPETTAALGRGVQVATLGASAAGEAPAPAAAPIKEVAQARIPAT
jgi:Family of unknown function (DUF6338)